MACFAAAIVTSGRIDAHGSLATSKTRALVDVEALNERVSVISRWTRAIDLIKALSALCGNSARVRLALGLLLGATSLVRISCSSCIAHALIGSETVLAMRIVATSRVTFRINSRRHAQQVRIANERGFTDTLSRINVTVGADSTNHSFATVFASSTDAGLGCSARLIGRALVGGT